MAHLIIKAHNKAQGGFVLVDDRNESIVSQGTLQNLIEQKEQLDKLGYGFDFTEGLSNYTLTYTTIHY